MKNWNMIGFVICTCCQYIVSGLRYLYIVIFHCLKARFVSCTEKNWWFQIWPPEVVNIGSHASYPIDSPTATRLGPCNSLVTRRVGTEWGPPNITVTYAHLPGLLSKQNHILSWFHGDVLDWRQFPHHWPFVQGILLWLVSSVDFWRLFVLSLNKLLRFWSIAADREAFIS